MLNRFASFVFVLVLVFVIGIIRGHVRWSKFTDVERAATIVFGSGGAKELDRNLTPIYGRMYRQFVYRQRLLFQIVFHVAANIVLMGSRQKERL